MKVHHLKIRHEPFQAIFEGRKRHEWRRDDRGFEVGDHLLLEEWNPVGSASFPGRHYTGRELVVEVTHLTRGPDFGIPEGFVAMSVDLGLDFRAALREVSEIVVEQLDEIAEGREELEGQRFDKEEAEAAHDRLLPLLKAARATVERIAECGALQVAQIDGERVRELEGAIRQVYESPDCYSDDCECDGCSMIRRVLVDVVPVEAPKSPEPTEEGESECSCGGCANGGPCSQPLVPDGWRS